MYRFWYDLRHKENKTNVEELLLEYRNIFITIDGIIVQESKSHYSKEKAIEEIKRQLQGVRSLA